MPGWLAEMSGFSVFLTIAATGFLFLLVSLCFGEIFGHFGDVHFGHGGPGFFSVRIMSVFITAFGGFGAVATESGLSTLPASGVGLASGASSQVSRGRAQLPQRPRARPSLCAERSE